MVHVVNVVSGDKKNKRRKQEKHIQLVFEI